MQCFYISPNAKWWFENISPTTVMVLSFWWILNPSKCCYFFLDYFLKNIFHRLLDLQPHWCDMTSIYIVFLKKLLIPIILSLINWQLVATSQKVVKKSKMKCQIYHCLSCLLQPFTLDTFKCLKIQRHLNNSTTLHGLTESYGLVTIYLSHFRMEKVDFESFCSLELHIYEEWDTRNSHNNFLCFSALN